MKDAEGFLEKLTQLSKEHGIYIGGCGCCNSPFLAKESDTIGARPFAGDVEFEDGEYKAKKIRYA